MENPGYLNDVNKQNPFYAMSMEKPPRGCKASTFTTDANAYMIAILQGTQDPRIGLFFATAGGAYVGDVYGDDPGAIPLGSGSSYFGPGIASSSFQDQWIMPAFESMFMQAEAMARGWIPGDANAMMQAAILESFSFLEQNALKVGAISGDSSASDAASYISNNPGITDLNANGGSTPLSKARFIAFQKYIAMCCMEPAGSLCRCTEIEFFTGYCGRGRLYFDQSQQDIEYVAFEGIVSAE